MTLQHFVEQLHQNADLFPHVISRLDLFLNVPCLDVVYSMHAWHVESAATLSISNSVLMPLVYHSMVLT